MNLINIGPNQTQITAGKWNVLFSYSTPVAAIGGGKAFKTEEKHSVTTSKHVNAWLKDNGLDPVTVPTKPQAWFDSLA
jgi:hypothetical protein